MVRQRKAKPDDDTPSKPVMNTDARKALMRECQTEMRAIQKAREVLNEEAGSIRERLKEADVNLKAFMDGMKMVHQDDVARDSYLAELKYMLEINGIGWQSEMFADDTATADAGGKAKPGYLEKPKPDASPSTH